MIQKQLPTAPSPGFIQFRKAIIVLNSELLGTQIQKRWKNHGSCFSTTKCYSVAVSLQLHQHQASPLSFANLAYILSCHMQSREFNQERKALLHRVHPLSSWGEQDKAKEQKVKTTVLARVQMQVNTIQVISCYILHPCYCLYFASYFLSLRQGLRAA